MQNRNISIFTGNANRVLARKITDYLELPLGKMQVRKFSDGENEVVIDENVRGQDVFVIQPTCNPVNHNFMELFVMLDAFRRSSVQKLTAVLPYYGYARQDKKDKPRVPITARLVADLLTASGATRVITMDLHAGQIQGFFTIPVDHLYAMPVFLDYIKSTFHQEFVIVSADVGGAVRARAYAKRLGADLAIIEKRRPQPNMSKVMNLIGDVDGKIAILIDDMVDTAGTLIGAAEKVMEKGALEVHACCTHPVLSGSAIERIEGSVFRSIIVTDTIPLRPRAKNCAKIKVLSVASLIGEAIIRSHRDDSVTRLFV